MTEKVPISRMHSLRILKRPQSPPITIPRIMIECQRVHYHSVLSKFRCRKVMLRQLNQRLLISPLRLDFWIASILICPVLLKSPRSNIVAGSIDAICEGCEPTFILSSTFGRCRAGAVIMSARHYFVGRTHEHGAFEDGAAGECAVGLVHRDAISDKS